MVSDNPAWSGSLLAWTIPLFLVGFCLCLVTYNPSAITPLIRAITRRPTQPLHQIIDSLCKEGKEYFIDKLRTGMGVNKLATARHPLKMPPSAAASLSNLKTTSQGYTHQTKSLAAETIQEKRIIPQSVVAVQNMTNGPHISSYVNQESLPNEKTASILAKHSGSPITILPPPIETHSHTSEPILPSATHSSSNVTTASTAVQTLNTATGSNASITTDSAPPQTPDTDASVERVLRRSSRVRKQTRKGMESEKQTKRYIMRKENGM